MLNLVNDWVIRFSDRLGVTPRELVASTLCVLLGAGYLVYTYFIISIFI